MACNYNEECQNLEKVVYPKHRENVNGYIDSLSTGLDDLINEMKEYNIPNDYLGYKVKEELKKIGEEIDTQKTFFSTEKQNINDFIDEKISEHNNHYWAWYNRNEKAKKKKDLPPLPNDDSKTKKFGKNLLDSPEEKAFDL